jgi:hypothetical protein
MTTPFGDGSARGATSTDRANVPPCRPEARRHRLSAVARPIVLGVDETVSAIHRSCRYRTAHPLQAPEERMRFFAGTALAIFSLVFVSAVALGSRLTSTAVLLFGDAGRRFDTFRSLHDPLVFALLFGFGVLGLLRPHLWDMEPARSEPKQRRLVRAKAAA